MNDTFIRIEDFPQYLERLRPEDWKPLLDLIPEIEQTTIFGEEKGGEQVRPGVYTFPYWDQSPVVSSFYHIVYELGIIIDFDWPGWDEGRKLTNPRNTGLDKIDLVTVCKLITAIVRNDRFYDGALVESFESGLMLRLLKRIRILVQGVKEN